MEIIPKETPRLPEWLNILFYILIFLFVASIVSIFILNSSLSNSLEDLSSLEIIILQKETPENASLEDKILVYRDKIRDFSYLADQHLMTSKVFGIVEGFCHPKVWFSNFGLDSRKGELSLNGKTDDFKNLGQQLLILKDEESITGYTLKEALIDSDGKIDFTLLINLSPETLE